jgi:predicted enzyme related to lactoylglutathione lyase
MEIEEGSGVNRAHLDLQVADLATASKKLIGSGAALSGEFFEAGQRWHTFLDTQGNGFCVIEIAD